MVQEEKNANKKSDPEGPLFLCCHSCSEAKKGSFKSYGTCYPRFYRFFIAKY